MTGIVKMNRNDWELLDRQLHELPRTRRNDGTMILAIVAVFFVGVAFGGSLFGHPKTPTQIAANDAVPGISIAR
jgi:hypothetical protein